MTPLQMLAWTGIFTLDCVIALVLIIAFLAITGKLKK